MALVTAGSLAAWWNGIVADVKSLANSPGLCCVHVQSSRVAVCEAVTYNKLSELVSDEPINTMPCSGSIGSGVDEERS